jgi:hypothetical protein
MTKRTPAGKRSIHRRGADRPFGALLIPEHAGVRLLGVKPRFLKHGRRNGDERTATRFMS